LPQRQPPPAVNRPYHLLWPLHIGTSPASFPPTS
jgi:hypothetical protein